MIRNQTIILIHGAGSISDAWDNFIKSLLLFVKMRTSFSDKSLLTIQNILSLWL